MPSFTTRRKVAFTPEQMYNLVADVEKYPQFLPLCEDLQIYKRDVDAQGRDVMVARMTCGYKALRESFTSRVTLNREASHILVEYIDGPFRYLENNWTFLPDTTTQPQRGPSHTDNSEVVFDIAYEFKSRLLGLVVGSLFDKAFRRFTAAFEDRAHQIYTTDSAAISKNHTAIMTI